MHFLIISAIVLIKSGLSAAIPQGNVLTRRQWTIGKPVDTTSGIVTGHHAPWPANSGVSEYLGIPYGQNPVGNLRFAAPKRFEGKGDQISGAQWVSRDFRSSSYSQAVLICSSPSKYLC
jgi:cholinesterase